LIFIAYLALLAALGAERLVDQLRPPWQQLLHLLGLGLPRHRGASDLPDLRCQVFGRRLAR
jgi:hypothetical protein